MVAPTYEWAKEVEAFEKTKAGVKGLVDAGVKKLPQFFVHSPESLAGPTSVNKHNDVQLDLPTIDFQGVLEVGSSRRRDVVEEIRNAAQDWGFFKIVNHGVPLETMDAMLEAVKRFHEQPTEMKKHLYSSDARKQVKFNSTLRENQPACWRDMLTCNFPDDQLDPEEIPLTCREEVQVYVNCMIRLREVMAELLSEALGLNSDYLSNMECMKSQALACLYYPTCPEPEKTLGTVKHSDVTFLTLLMQDNTGGLQIVHDNQWFDVPPARGAFIVNIGDLMQVISNNKFISVEHRVLSQPIGPRISVACFIAPSRRALGKPIAPIEEILSEEDEAVYREFMFVEYIEHYKKTGQGAIPALPHFRIR